MSAPAIRIRGANKCFGATHAVRNLDLEVPTGSLCGFLGPNGAGKSTTIRMIMSIIRPDSGAIDVLGSDALRTKDRIGYLPEERGVYRKMRVGDFLEYMARLKGLRGPGLHDRVQAWLDRVELPGVTHRKCEELSKGMQQKVQFVAAVIHAPDLLILDEPFSGLDPVNADMLNRLIRELHAGGTTIIFSTHVLHHAEQLCDRIFLINKGTKLLDASLDEIHARFDPRSVRARPLHADASIGAIPGAGEIVRTEDGAFDLLLDEGANPQAVMAAALAAAPMRSVELRRLTLEEVFVRLVREDAGAEAAALAREELAHV